MSPDAIFFRTVITDKIKVKTYLTDRVLTGDHKTNREKRWETHPIQFILLNVAFAWELNMLSLRKFALSKVFLKQQSISYDRLTYCLKSFPLPMSITGDALSYEAFRIGLLNPTHGKSDFQVGHLNPLKLGIR